MRFPSDKQKWLLKVEVGEKERAGNLGKFPVMIQIQGQAGPATAGWAGMGWDDGSSAWELQEEPGPIPTGGSCQTLIC